MAYEKNKVEDYTLLGGINIKASEFNNAPTEFRDLTNFNFLYPGALTKRPGTSLYNGATVLGRITGGFEFERLNGASYIIATANTNAYTVGSGFVAFRSGLQNGALFDFLTFVDRLFCANGANFFKFDGNNSSNFSLPPGASGFGLTGAVGGGLSGIYIGSYGYVNDRGYQGPVGPGVTITLNGVTFGSIRYYGLTTPNGFGITSLQFFRTGPDQLDLFGTTFAPAGASLFTDTGFPLSSRLANDNMYFTLAPKYLELFNNQLFMAGFSSALSTVYWSQIGEPEGIDPTFFAEFRTNDGDRITGLKFYAGQLVVTKERSLHRLLGDNPNNFTIQQISDQYGCISNRSLVVFGNLLWGLDTKGIFEYNGASVDIVSNKVEPIFAAMNIDAARENAVAIHNRDQNEVWFSIPCNGATLNNCTVVYDYVSNAWTKYEGFNPSTVFVAQGNRPKLTPFYGGYSGNVFYFSPSLMNDNGAAITCMLDSRWVTAMGNTTEQQFRRFYLNLDPIVGFTQPISVNFKTNYGQSFQISRTMYQAPFQSRVDFGLSAKSIAAQVYHVSASLPLKINGFTFESRFQRNV